jgi:hypothetical protein
MLHSKSLIKQLLKISTDLISIMQNILMAPITEPVSRGGGATPGIRMSTSTDGSKAQNFYKKLSKRQPY